MRLTLSLDTETAAALVRVAVRDLRTIDMQAEFLIRQSLGLKEPAGDLVTEGGDLRQRRAVREYQTAGPKMHEAEVRT